VPRFGECAERLDAVEHREPIPYGISVALADALIIDAFETIAKSALTRNAGRGGANWEVQIATSL
jgi:hypothetical protein